MSVGKRAVGRRKSQDRTLDNHERAAQFSPAKSKGQWTDEEDEIIKEYVR